MKVRYPKLYNMAHLLALNVLLLPKDLTIIFIHNKYPEMERTYRNLEKRDRKIIFFRGADWIRCKAKNALVTG